jgi:hypothetical protein
VSSGVAVRPADGDGVHSKPGFTIGGHARVRVFPWLAVRLLGRTESSPYSYDQRALGLPPGTRIDQPSPTRIYLSADVEPTWSPVARLDLWAGVGIGWGRALASTLRTDGAETVNVPERAAVIVDVPLSLGARYEVVPEWLVVNLSGTVAPPVDQSGELLKPYTTPGSDGRLLMVNGFPEVRTSFIALAGLGVLL